MRLSLNQRPAEQHGRAKRALLVVAAMVVTGGLLAPLTVVEAIASGNLPGLDSAETAVERFQVTQTGGSSSGTDDADLRNTQHLYNFNPGGDPASARGTDVEFYTPTIPARDESGEIILDAEGNPVMVTRDFAIMGAYDRGAYVFDITDPENVKFVVNIPCNQTQNDVQIARIDGRWLLALARDGSTNPCVSPRLGTPNAAGIAVFDVSDPYAYKPLWSFRTTGGAHNFTFHPTKPYGYVSTGDLPGALNHIPIIDFTDVMNPKLAADISVEGGPHDISFNTTGTRAYVASENNMRIYDTTDPKNPVLLSRSVGLASYVHGADPTPDGKHVIFTDESLVLGGFFTNRQPVCPGGGFSIYNVEGTNERNPVPLSYNLANIQGTDPSRGGACTAHVGRITPNSKYYITGWYRGGSRVFDISNPALVTEVGHAMMDGPTGWTGEVWAAKPHKGNYIYAADMRRGFDVFKWTGPDLGMPPLGE